MPYAPPLCVRSVDVGPFGESLSETRKKAEQGDANAQNNLGLMYEFGIGVPKDSTEAVKWYRKSAEQGDADAQGNLGVMYAGGNGTGVPKDLVQTLMWWCSAHPELLVPGTPSVNKIGSLDQ